MPGDNGCPGRDKEEVPLVPVAVEQVLQQGDAAGNFFVFPVSGSGLFLGDFSEAVVGTDADSDEGDLRIIALGIAEFFRGRSRNQS